MESDKLRFISCFTTCWLYQLEILEQKTNPKQTFMAWCYRNVTQLISRHTGGYVENEAGCEPRIQVRGEEMTIWHSPAYSWHKSEDGLCNPGRKHKKGEKGSRMALGNFDIQNSNGRRENCERAYERLVQEGKRKISKIWSCWKERGVKEEWEAISKDYGRLSN